MRLGRERGEARTLSPPAAPAATSTVQVAAVADHREEDVRLACLELAAKMLGNRGAAEVLATAETFVAYVQAGAINVQR